MRKFYLTALAIFLAVGVTKNVQAFRCGSELVGRGDSVVKLLSKCGKPGYKDYAVEKINGRWESVETWTYNCGINDFIYELTIIGSRIVSEDTAGRGSGVSECQGR